MPGPTHKGQQPNSNKDSRRQSRSNEKLPPQRSRAREDIDEAALENFRQFAVNTHIFTHTLLAAAAWRRGELPSTFPFGLCFWLIIASLSAAITG